jgi:hypothetical protein
MNAIVNVTFKGGPGTVNVDVLRAGSSILPGPIAISSTGLVTLTNVLSGDIIYFQGSSPSGGTDISIDIPTGPPTPSHYPPGLIMGAGYLVL